jgi:hypothetical protein
MARKKELTAKEMGRLGGAARAKKLTAQELSESGRKAAKARWAKKSESKGGN